MKTETLFSHSSDEWSTPQDLFNQLDSEFNFTLDPCATEENHKCKKWYSKQQDGLKQDWGGGNQCSAILRIQRLASGLRKHIGKGVKIILLWFSWFSPVLIQNGFTTTVYTEQKYAS